jgi:hypothetical protein
VIAMLHVTTRVTVPHVVIKLGLYKEKIEVVHKTKAWLEQMKNFIRSAARALTNRWHILCLIDLLLAIIVALIMPRAFAFAGRARCYF